MTKMTENEWKEWLENLTDEEFNASIRRVSEAEFDQENPNWKKDKAILKAEKQRRARAKNKAKPMGKKDGGFAKGSAEGSTIKMNHGGHVKGKGSMLSITIEQKPINKKTMNMIKQAEKAGNVVKMSSGGAAKRGYGKARR